MLARKLLRAKRKSVSRMRPSKLSAHFILSAAFICSGFCASEQPAEAQLPPVAGARCLDSLQLKSNLPLWDGSRSAEIVEIDGFMPPAGGEVAGFLYTTRRPAVFVQVKRNEVDAAIAAFINIDETRLAGVAKSQRGSSSMAIFPVLPTEERRIIAKLRSRGQLYPCFTHPLP